MASAANVLIKIGANAGQAVGEIRKVENALGKQMTASQKASNVTRKAAVPAALALVALAGAAIACAKAAAEDEAAQVKLAGQLRRVTGATDAAVASAEDYITKLSLATGVADDDLRPALATLATVTGNVEKAQQGLAITLDVAAASGKNTATVSKALAKAYAGDGAALAKLIPGLDKAAVKSGDFARINAELARVTGGAAAEAAGTAAGQFRIFELTIAETKEQIGAAFLPVLSQIAPYLVRLAALLKDNTKAILIIGGAIAALAVAVITVNAALSAYQAIASIVRGATIAWTAAQFLLNVALTANPIGLIVVAIAALVAGIILAYRNSETFRNIVDTLFAAVTRITMQALRPFIDNWKEISAAIDFVVKWLKILWPLLVPGGLVYLALKTAEEKFGAVSFVINYMRDSIRNAITAAGDIKDAFVVLAAVASTTYTTLRNGITTTLDPIARAFDRIVQAIQDVVEWIKKIRFPSLPSWLSSLGSTSLSTRTTGLSSMSGGTTVNVTINGPIDSDSTAREILKVLNQYDRRYNLVGA
jgi:phage-related protein